MIRTVLLVEDESRIREIVADYFIKEQWNVIEAEDGVQALEQLALHQVDLVILDVLMPEMDGWTLCGHIRSTSAVPIIMLTARSEDDDKIHGFQLGVDDYVTKPFSPRVLVARAETLMKRVEGAMGREQGLFVLAMLFSIHGVDVWREMGLKLSLHRRNMICYSIWLGMLALSYPVKPY